LKTIYHCPLVENEGGEILAFLIRSKFYTLLILPLAFSEGIIVLAFVIRSYNRLLKTICHCPLVENEGEGENHNFSLKTSVNLILPLAFSEGIFVLAFVMRSYNTLLKTMNHCPLVENEGEGENHNFSLKTSVNL